MPSQTNQRQSASTDLHSVALLRRIRVKKEDSAFVYCVLESYEGITSYSTLNTSVSEAYRDLELQIPTGFLKETEQVLELLKEMVVVIS